MISQEDETTFPRSDRKALFSCIKFPFLQVVNMKFTKLSVEGTRSFPLNFFSTGLCHF